ncbi:hypothetical protein BZZ01_04730 [Nostocales cyanobacterium HT-58-2]|nr:hypothetical protein BZZ01_04730 [Nostocales cyanobacterium HT-58-2]
MRRQLDRLYRENEVTYRGVLLLATSLNFLAICINQILLQTGFKFQARIPHFAGTFDIIAISGLLLAAISGYFAFKQIQMADEGARDTKQHAIKEEIIREINEGKADLEKIEEKLDKVAQDIYALNLEFGMHIKSEIHPGALRKFMFIEDKLYEVAAAVALLGRDAEYGLRLSKLEEKIEKLDKE